MNAHQYQALLAFMAQQQQDQLAQDSGPYSIGDRTSAINNKSDIGGGIGTVGMGAGNLNFGQSAPPAEMGQPGSPGVPGLGQHLFGRNQALVAALQGQHQGQQALNSGATRAMGQGVGPLAQGQMMGQDYRLLDEQTRKMAELQAQGAMIQPDMPTMPTMGKEEKGLLQLAKLFAIGSGVDPRQIAQEEQNYNQRRQQEIQLAHQNATQLALAQANQQMGANKADQYRLGAEGQITEGRVGRREKGIAAAAAIAAEERKHQQNLELKKNDPAAQVQRMMELFGMNYEQARDEVNRLNADQTPEKAKLMGAQTDNLVSATAKNAAITDRIKKLAPHEVTLLKEKAEMIKLQRKYLPDDYAIKRGMLQLRIDQLSSLNSYRDASLDLGWSKFEAGDREALKAEAADVLKDLGKEVESLKGNWRTAQVNVWSMLGVQSDDEMGAALAKLRKLAETDENAYKLLPRVEQEMAKALIHHKSMKEAEADYKEAESELSKALFDRETAAGRPPVQGPAQRPGSGPPKAPAPNRGNSQGDSHAQALGAWGDSIFGDVKKEQFSGKPRMTRGSSGAGGSPSKHNHGAALDVYHRTGVERQSHIDKAVNGGATLIIDYQGQRTWKPGRGWKSDPSLDSSYNHIHVENDKAGGAAPAPKKAPAQTPKKPTYGAQTPIGLPAAKPKMPESSGSFWQDIANATKGKK